MAATNEIVPDTSIIIDGKLSELLGSGRLDDVTIIIPEVVVTELENQANSGREIGDAGLEEINELQQIAKERGMAIEFTGRKPTSEEMELAESGRMDALIRDIAEERGATLYTADRVQALVARAKNIPCKYFPHEEDDMTGLPLQEYFDDKTMSVHLKQGMVPKAKKGDPGKMEYIPIGDTPFDRHTIDRLASDVFEFAKRSEDGLVEMDKDGATVLQIKDFRIAITRPPFSEKIEITAVRPVAKLTLDDYDLSEKFKQRLQQKAEGILVAGAPGHGKSTFAQALASFYNDQGRVVKTMEHPRDLDVGPEITQYAALEEDMANTGDLLLLVRPDYTVFDEVRKTEDFEVFADMRLAGVGMIGVVHASEALDAVQRLIGRVDMGVIPQVVDTVVFIRNAGIAKVYELKLTVKVPSGMQEQDLARPVVLVKDFETGEAEYEIYTYGEETVVIPIQEGGGKQESGTHRLAKRQLAHELKRYVKNPEIEFESDDAVTIYVDEDKIARLIGKNGETINRIEDEVGLSITVEPKETKTLKEEVAVALDETGNSVVVEIHPRYAGKEVDLYDGNKHLVTATAGKNGQIRITKDSDTADKLLGAFAGNRLSAYV